MKFKRLVVLTTIITFSSSLVIGATYDLSDDEILFPKDQDFTFIQELTTRPDSSFDNLEFSRPQNHELKQEFQETLALMKNGETIAAEKKIKNLIQQYPQEAQFYNLLATIEITKKVPDKAIQIFKKAIKLAPNNLQSHLGIASIYLQTNNLILAKQYANSALSIKSNSPHAYIILAEVSYREKNFLEAETYLIKAQNKAQGNSKNVIMVADKLAKLYFIQKQPKKVLNVAQGIINRFPDDSTALNLLANAQIVNNKPELAIATLKKLINQESTDVQHRLLLAKLLTKQSSNNQQISKLLDEIDAIAPNNNQVQVQKTILLTQLKLFPKALQSVKKVKKLAPDSGLAEILEAEIYLAEKKQELALSAFQKSYKIKSNIKVMSVIVKLMIAQNKQTDAINFLSQEVKENPKNLAAHFDLGSLYHQQNNTLEAKKHYQVILAEQPDNVVILNNLAWIYHLENNPKALKLAKLAYQKAPKSADIADTYAVILAKQGELTKAIKVLQKASHMAPEKYDIQYHLADAYAKKGQNRQAIEILKTITQSKQDFSEKQAAVSLLKKLN